MTTTWDDGTQSVIYQNLFGTEDNNIRYLESAMDVSVQLRGGDLMIEGDAEENVAKARLILKHLYRLAERGETISTQTVKYAMDLMERGEIERLDDLFREAIVTSFRGKPVRCKTVGQASYVDAIRKNTLTFGIGPAGTGKTYLAMAMAVSALKAHDVERIILTRPAVEAGEKLGFLPGDLSQKVDPYLRPLYDAMMEMLGGEACQRLQERGVIEVAPLAYMRGRTLSDAFIILDEAQNTTREQMKMFLTRMGFRSKIVVTGDPSQIDLPLGKTSGLKDAVTILKDIRDIAIVELTHHDVVRHELVQRIVQAYENPYRFKEGAKDDRKEEKNLTL